MQANISINLNQIKLSIYSPNTMMLKGNQKLNEINQIQYFIALFFN